MEAFAVKRFLNDAEAKATTVIRGLNKYTIIIIHVIISIIDLSASRFADLGLSNYIMFPCPENKIEGDDYGEHDEFLSKMALDATAPEAQATSNVRYFFSFTFN